MVLNFRACGNASFRIEEQMCKRQDSGVFIADKAKLRHTLLELIGYIVALRSNLLSLYMEGFLFVQST